LLKKPIPLQPDLQDLHVWQEVWQHFCSQQGFCSQQAFWQQLVSQQVFSQQAFSQQLFLLQRLQLWPAKRSLRKHFLAGLQQGLQQVVGQAFWQHSGLVWQHARW
jgi:hypothetical protein